MVHASDSKIWEKEKKNALTNWRLLQLYNVDCKSCSFTEVFPGKRRAPFVYFEHSSQFRFISLIGSSRFTHLRSHTINSLCCSHSCNGVIELTNLFYANSIEIIACKTLMAAFLGSHTINPSTSLHSAHTSSVVRNSDEIKSKVNTNAAIWYNLSGYREK